jgi:methyl coenzyme M reductase gamma subunit
MAGIRTEMAKTSTWCVEELTGTVAVVPASAGGRGHVVVSGHDVRFTESGVGTFFTAERDA